MPIVRPNVSGKTSKRLNIHISDSRVDGDEPVGIAPGDVEVVGGDEHELAQVVGDGAEQCHRGVLALVVEEGGGLVEEQDGCLLGDGTCDHHLLPLTVAERGEVAVGKGLRVCACHRLRYEGFVCLLEFPEEPGVGHASHGDDLARREVQQVWLLGQYNGKKARTRRCRERGAVVHRSLGMINDTPRKRWLQACEGAEKGRFANAVAAYETHEAPGF